MSSHFILFIFFFYEFRTNIVQNFFGTHEACFCSVVVITCASHAQGPQFDPGQKHSKLINFRLYCSDKHVYLIRVRSVKTCYYLMKKYVSNNIHLNKNLRFEQHVI